MTYAYSTNDDNIKKNKNIEFQKQNYYFNYKGPKKIFQARSTSKFKANQLNDFNIETVNSEDEGFRIVDERIDEIVGILVDLDLTRASGYRILKLLAQDKIYASVPVIAVIDHTPDASDMDCFENGFADLLYPPGFREQIVKRVQNAIRAKDSFTYSEMQKMLKQLPSNIYLKDAEGRYVFCTQYWHQRQYQAPTMQMAT